MYLTYIFNKFNLCIQPIIIKYQFGNILSVKIQVSLRQLSYMLVKKRMEILDKISKKIKYSKGNKGERVVRNSTVGFRVQTTGKCIGEAIIWS